MINKSKSKTKAPAKKAGASNKSKAIKPKSKELKKPLMAKGVAVRVNSKPKDKQPGNPKSLIGNVLSTHDKYLPNKKNKNAIMKERRVAVVEQNKTGGLGVVKLTTQNTSNTTKIKDYRKGNGKDTFFKNFLETEDNEKKPIMVNDKFKTTDDKNKLKKSQINTIKQTLFDNIKQGSRNRVKKDELHKR